MARHQQLVAAVGELHRAEVGPVVGQFHHVSAKVGAVKVLTRMPHAYEIERARVWSPAVVVYIGVETLRHILLASVGEVVHTQPVAVALVAVTRHALPCHVLAVGRESRINVIAHVEV